MLASFLPSYISARGRSIRAAAFFALVCLYLWREVDLRVIYHGGGTVTDFPIFYRGWSFFEEFLSYPGGLVAYASAFLSQLWYYGWAGAVVATVQAWLLCLCIDVITKELNATRLGWIRFVPALLLLILYNRYSYRFVTTMALLVSLVSICLYLTGTRRNRIPRLAVFMALAVIVHYLAGGAVLVFGAFGVIYELLLRRSWLTALACFCLALAIPWVCGVLILNVPVFDAYAKLTPWSWEAWFYGGSAETLVIVYALYALAPLTALLCAAWRLLPRHPARKANPTRAKGIHAGNGRKIGKQARCSKWFERASALSSRSMANAKVTFIARSLALFVTAAAVVFFSHDRKLKTLHKIDFYAYHRKWPELLASVQRRPTNNSIVIHAVNRALYHTGRLGYDMLSYPQHPHALFLSDARHESFHWYRCDTHLQLGLINLAEHSLTKALETFGERPTLLKRLAFVNMAKGDTDTARVYLNALSKTLFDANWAGMYLERLESDPNLETDREIQQLRQRRSPKDFDLLLCDYDHLLLDLLRQNPKNRMACEYLMACYLMGRRHDLLAQNIHRLDGLGYSEIARLYEEAAIVHSITIRQPPTHPIGAESLRRWEGFRQTLKPHGTDVKAALHDLKRQYGDTYFFYNLYGFTGAEK